jgi:hypothetical protein
MRARAQNRFMLVLSAAKLAVTGPLVLGGLRLLGPIGALAGFVAAEGLTRAAMLARAARLFETGAGGILPLRALGRQLAGTTLSAPGAWIALHSIHGPLFLRLAAAGLAFGAVYLAFTATRGGLPTGWAALFRRRAGSAGRSAPAGSGGRAAMP